MVEVSRAIFLFSLHDLHRMNPKQTRNEPVMATKSVDSFGSLLYQHRKILSSGLQIGETWTQQRLAEKVGVSVETISLWEHNKSCPTNANFLALLRAFGFDPKIVGENNESVVQFVIIV